MDSTHVCAMASVASPMRACHDSERRDPHRLRMPDRFAELFRALNIARMPLNHSVVRLDDSASP